MKKVISMMKGKGKDRERDPSVSSRGSRKSLAMGQLPGPDYATPTSLRNASSRLFKSTSHLDLGSVLSYGGEKRDKSTPKLHHAALTGDIDKVKKHLRKSDINSIDPNGRSPLHLAAAAGHINILYHLVANGAYINSQDSEGSTPLQKAVESDQIAAVQFLLDRGAATDTPDGTGNTAAHTAVRHRNNDALAVILRKGGNPDIINYEGESPLHLAVDTGDEELVENLLRNGAMVNITTHQLITPVMLAAKKSLRNIISLLVEYDAKLTVKDCEGRTVFDYANGKKVVDLLRELDKSNEPVTCFPSKPAEKDQAVRGDDDVGAVGGVHVSAAAAAAVVLDGDGGSSLSSWKDSASSHCSPQHNSNPLHHTSNTRKLDLARFMIESESDSGGDEEKEEEGRTKTGPDRGNQPEQHNNVTKRISFDTVSQGSVASSLKGPPKPPRFYDSVENLHTQEDQLVVEIPLTDEDPGKIVTKILLVDDEESIDSPVWSDNDSLGFGDSQNKNDNAQDANKDRGEMKGKEEVEEEILSNYSPSMNKQNSATQGCGTLGRFGTMQGVEEIWTSSSRPKDEISPTNNKIDVEKDEKKAENSRSSNSIGSPPVPAPRNIRKQSTDLADPNSGRCSPRSAAEDSNKDNPNSFDSSQSNFECDSPVLRNTDTKQSSQLLKSPLYKSRLDLSQLESEAPPSSSKPRDELQPSPTKYIESLKKSALDVSPRFSKESVDVDSKSSDTSVKASVANLEKIASPKSKLAPLPPSTLIKPMPKKLEKVSKNGSVIGQQVKQDITMCDSKSISIESDTGNKANKSSDANNENLKKCEKTEKPGEILKNLTEKEIPKLALRNKTVGGLISSQENSTDSSTAIPDTKPTPESDPIEALGNVRPLPSTSSQHQSVPATQADQPTVNLKPGGQPSKVTTLASALDKKILTGGGSKPVTAGGSKTTGTVGTKPGSAGGSKPGSGEGGKTVNPPVAAGGGRQSPSLVSGIPRKVSSSPLRHQLSLFSPALSTRSSIRSNRSSPRSSGIQQEPDSDEKEKGGPARPQRPRRKRSKLRKRESSGSLNNRKAQQEQSTEIEKRLQDVNLAINNLENSSECSLHLSTEEGEEERGEDIQQFRIRKRDTFSLLAKTSLRKLEQQREEYLKIIDNLVAKNNELNEEKGREQIRRQETELEREVLRVKLETLCGTNSALTEELDTQQDRLSNSCRYSSRLEIELSELKTRHEFLEEHIQASKMSQTPVDNSLQEQVDQLSQELAEKNSQIQEYKIELEKNETRVEDMATINSLREDLTAKTEYIEEKEGDIARLCHEVNQLKEKLRLEQERCDDSAKNNNAEQEAQHYAMVEELKTVKEILREELLTKDETARQHETEIRNHQAELKLLQEDKKTLESSVTELTAASKSLQAVIDQKTREIGEVSQRLSETSQTLVKTEETVNQLETEIDSREEDWKRQAEDNKAFLDEKDEVISSLINKLESKQDPDSDRLAKDQQNLARLETLLEEKEEVLNQLKHKLELNKTELKDRLEEKEKEIEKLSKLCEGRQEENVELKETLNKKIVELDSLEETITNKENELRGYRSKLEHETSSLINCINEKDQRIRQLEKQCVKFQNSESPSRNRNSLKIDAGCQCDIDIEMKYFTLSSIRDEVNSDSWDNLTSRTTNTTNNNNWGGDSGIDTVPRGGLITSPRSTLSRTYPELAPKPSLSLCNIKSANGGRPGLTPKASVRGEEGERPGLAPKPQVESRILALQAQVEQYRANEVKFEKILTEHKQFKIQLEKCELELEQRETALAEAKENLNESERRAKKISVFVAEQTERVASLEDRLNTNEGEKTRISAKLKDALKETIEFKDIIAQLQMQIDIESHRLQKEEGRAGEYSRTIAKLERELSGLRKQHEKETKNLHVVINDLEEQVKMGKETVKENQNISQKLKSELEDERQTCQQLHREVEQLEERERLEKRNTREKSREDKRKGEDEQERLTRLVEKYEDEVRRRKEVESRLASALKTNEKESNFGAKLLELEHEAAVLRKQNQHLETDLARTRDKYLGLEDVLTENRELQEAVLQRDSAISQLQHQLDNIREEEETRLQQTLDRLRTEYEIMARASISTKLRKINAFLEEKNKRQEEVEAEKENMAREIQVQLEKRLGEALAQLQDIREKLKKTEEDFHGLEARYEKREKLLKTEQGIRKQLQQQLDNLLKPRIGHQAGYQHHQAGYQQHQAGYQQQQHHPQLGRNSLDSPLNNSLNNSPHRNNIFRSTNSLYFK